MLDYYKAFMTEQKQRPKNRTYCFRCCCNPHCNKNCDNCKECKVCDCPKCLQRFNVDG